MKKILKYILIFAGTVVITQGLILGGITLYSNNCKKRVYEEIEEKVDDEFLSGNIMIATHVTQIYEMASTSCYPTIGSGVIFERDGDTYYALTAYHIYNIDGDSLSTHIEGEGEPTTEVEMIVISYDSISAEEQRASSDEIWWNYDTEELYEDYPRAALEYINEEDDLAIISFESDEQLSVIPFSTEEIYKGEKIMCIGNTEEGRYQRGYGKISSTKLKDFQAKGDDFTTQVIEHNAYVTGGYSGGAVVNENMELVGITTGGTLDFMGHFINGTMIPLDTINEDIQEWKNQ